MKTKFIRVEQKIADTEAIDEIVNKEIAILEAQGFSIKDVRLSVGRDAWEDSDIEVRYSVSMILLYD
ncbi:hypothetical protein HN604_00130 [archaeon]|jgi:hypothetical protein|nr:hypothetical protein [archaeon]MBT6182533.1 hypothetical protein [archaeon]MBT6606414.1 hypothetical protein [archaeon]MBT7251417.1 hypothetical protein [archaeon]MBT7660472.1 hypothetical protein [archaeon]